MPTTKAIRWFKTAFQKQIQEAVSGTPFTVDLLTAIACQETGSIWGPLHDELGREELLAICVGDTLDAPNRSAFPRDRNALVKHPRGQEMFELAHQALVEMAKHVKGFANVAKNPDKFCHGYGIFQYDLQFFKTDPDYFLQKRYQRFDASLAKAIGELKSKQQTIGLGGRATLSEMELVSVAIAYNTGGFKPAKGLKQGHFDGTRFYGEAVFDFLRLSQTVAANGASPTLLAATQPGAAPLPPASPLTATGDFFEVDVHEDTLNVRREPLIPKAKPQSNVVARLPDGHIVRSRGTKKQNGFMEVETSVNGALIRGFAFAKFLRPAVEGQGILVEKPAAAPPTSGIVAVHAPRAAGSVTRRTAIATAQSLNESGQPARTGDTAEERRADLAAITEWLAVDSLAHKRYQPRAGLTFCNIYAHDFCHLAGCYLPRVWWTQGSIEKLAKGEAVKPRLAITVEEVRANGLFRWLRDFGMRFGWRQTGGLTKLQTEVNQGAIGLIVARRIVEGRSGHIVMVVPEVGGLVARRDGNGAVTSPLQSQAGSTNFRHGTGKVEWFKGAQFAEFAFWLHS
ncbi:MAG TPA: hypothetical protein VE913_19380 [Longimicrobium sp.]|nr:hypothetical protein [Longimicrobium sp.]